MLYFIAIILVSALIYLAIFREARLKSLHRSLMKYGYGAFKLNSSNTHTRINIVGYNYTTYEEVAKFARQYLNNNQNINNKDILESLKSEIQTLPWVSEVLINISLQDSLNIRIKEYEPFAVWQDEERQYVVSKDSKIIAVDDIEQFNNLVILTGKNAPKNVGSLFDILSIDKEISKNIYSATWIGDRRWDIRFVNGLLVKLPSIGGDNMKDVGNNLMKIYNLSGSSSGSLPSSLVGLKTIDLRIANKIYLEYDQGSIEEIKNL